MVEDFIKRGIRDFRVKGGERLREGERERDLNFFFI